MSVQEITDQDFKEKVSSGVVMVDFWAPWCAPCRAIAPILDELSKEMPDVNILKMNVDENPSIASEFGITSIPTLLVFQNGNMVERTMGAANKETYKGMLEKYLT